MPQVQQQLLPRGTLRAEGLQTPLHHSQKELEHTDDHTLFSYYLRPSFDLVQELLSMGETVEVLEPASLRSEMERIGKEIVKRHKGKRK
ncbi:MAG: WYL domain-containing protein [Bacteroidales bacterium]|nr:WYL domain-containing protein [Bacteroidales bacterium]